MAIKSYSLKFIEKSNEAIFKLLTGERDARSRLMYAQTELAMSLSWPIGHKEFEMRQLEIWNRLTSKGAIMIDETVLMTPLQNTVSAMRNKSASRIIADFYHLKSEIDDYLRSSYNY